MGKWPAEPFPHLFSLVAIQGSGNMNVENITPGEISTQKPVATQTRSRKRRIAIFVGACIVNTALFVLFLTQLLTPAQPQSQSGTHASSTANLGDSNSPLLGKPAPDFTLPVLSGSAGSAVIHLADLKGKAVILNFWASWCAPCNDEAPFLQKAWPGLRGQGIALIGIDGSEKSSDALTFMRKYGISYPTVQDTVNSATALDYSVTGLPVTIFIDRKGVVVAKWASPLNEQGLQLEMAKIAQ